MNNIKVLSDEERGLIWNAVTSYEGMLDSLLKMTGWLVLLIPVLLAFFFIEDILTYLWSAKAQIETERNVLILRVLIGVMIVCISGCMFIYGLYLYYQIPNYLEHKKAATNAKLNYKEVSYSGAVNEILIPALKQQEASSGSMNCFESSSNS